MENENPTLHSEVNAGGVWLADPVAGRALVHSAVRLADTHDLHAIAAVALRSRQVLLTSLQKNYSYNVFVFRIGYPLELGLSVGQYVCLYVYMSVTEPSGSSLFRGITAVIRSV